MLEELREEVLKANLALPRNNLVVGTTGNVSGIDRESGYIIIKPSGVDYDGLKKEDLVVVDFEGKVVEGKKKPSVDTPHHLYLYRKIKNLGGVIHTHSPYATMFALLEQPIPVYSTAHADIFGVEIPCTPYVNNRTDHIGKAILRSRQEGCPAILLGKHGVFTFDETPAKALRASIMLESVALIAQGALELASTLRVNLSALPPEEAGLWYARHHGGGYGQDE